eukprot:scaffold18220_cov101-Isochrysis_galbana.AAC.2
MRGRSRASRNEGGERVLCETASLGRGRGGGRRPRPSGHAYRGGIQFPCATFSEHVVLFSRAWPSAVGPPLVPRAPDCPAPAAARRARCRVVCAQPLARTTHTAALAPPAPVPTAAATIRPASRRRTRTGRTCGSGAGARAARTAACTARTRGGALPASIRRSGGAAPLYARGVSHAPSPRAVLGPRPQRPALAGTDRPPACGTAGPAPKVAEPRVAALAHERGLRGLDVVELERAHKRDVHAQSTVGASALDAQEGGVVQRDPGILSARRVAVEALLVSRASRDSRHTAEPALRRRCRPSLPNRSVGLEVHACRPRTKSQEGPALGKKRSQLFCRAPVKTEPLNNPTGH